MIVSPGSRCPERSNATDVDIAYSCPAAYSLRIGNDTQRDLRHAELPSYTSKVGWTTFRYLANVD
jgi:hypothetical protein